MSSYTEGLHITDNPACNEFMRGEWGDFPRIQFDRKLGAELAPGETIDVAEKSLKEYLKYAGKVFQTMEILSLCTARKRW